jgi:predicted choloylglycine hydrolase
MRLIHAVGSAFEIGYQVGSQAGDLARQAVALICRFDEPEDRLDERLSAVERTLEAGFPHVLEEAEGIACGAGLEFRDVLALSVCSDLSGRLPAYCSLAAVHTSAGPLVGKNLDAPLEMGPLQVVERIEPDEGLSFVHITTAGAMWTDGGVNDAGLVLVNASLAPSQRREEGIPDGILAREILRTCASLPAAIELAARYDVRTLGENMLVADAAGRSAVVEKLPGAQAVREPDDDAPLLACNHVLSDALERFMDAGDAIRENSLERFERLEDERRSPGEWTEDRLRSVLTDGSLGVKQDGSAGIWTVASMLLAPVERRFSIVSSDETVLEVAFDSTPTPYGGGKEESLHGKSRRQHESL